MRIGILPDFENVAREGAKLIAERARLLGKFVNQCEQYDHSASKFEIVSLQTS